MLPENAAQIELRSSGVALDCSLFSQPSFTPGYNLPLLRSWSLRQEREVLLSTLRHTEHPQELWLFVYRKIWFA